MEPLPIVIVSPDPLARAGLVALLSGRSELSVAGVGSPAEAASLSAEHPGAPLLVDLGAGGDGVTGVAAAAPAASVIALAPDEDSAAEALAAGARGVLLRGSTADAIAAALAAAAHGLRVVDARHAAFLRAPRAGGAAEPLTPREREVLGLLSAGLTNRAIAERLGISEHTAKFHVNSILAKLGAGSRAEAIVRAARLGLVVL